MLTQIQWEIRRRNSDNVGVGFAVRVVFANGRWCLGIGATNEGNIVSLSGATQHTRNSVATTRVSPPGRPSHI